MHNGLGSPAIGDHGSLIYKNEGNIGLLNLLPPGPGRILDCGCGAGDNARILSSRGWRVTGVTIDSSEQETAREFCEHVYMADLEKGLPPRIGYEFRAVLASHILEHLTKPEQLLCEMRQRLAPGGVVAVALPNIAHYSQRLLRFRGQFHYTDTGPLDRTHLRFYTYRTAIDLLESCGYDVLDARVEGSLPWWKARGLLPAAVINSADQRAVLRWPNLFGRQTLLLAKPRDDGVQR
jgi:SAM-dependent methyltransferase